MQFPSELIESVTIALTGLAGLVELEATPWRESGFLADIIGLQNSERNINADVRSKVPSEASFFRAVLRQI
jgi:hypothetical protein